MKYIYNYIEHSLNESFNSKEAKKQFLDKGLISKKDFAIIKKAFLPKYVYWGCRERSKEENVNTILDSIYDVTVWFENNKQYLKSKDIYTYTYEEVRLLMNDPSIGPKKKKTKGQGKFEIVYEDDKGNKLVRVDDHAASIYWAHKYMTGSLADGQWCTAAYNTDGMFKQYSSTNPIYIIILPGEKASDLQRICAVDSNELETEPLTNYDFIETKTGKKTSYNGISNKKEVISYTFYSASDKRDKEIIKNASSMPSKIKSFFIKYVPVKISQSDILDIKKIKIKDIKAENLFSIFFASKDYYYEFGDMTENEGLKQFYSEGPLKNEIIKYISNNIIYLTDETFVQEEKHTTYSDIIIFLEKNKDYKYFYKLFDEFFISKIELTIKNYKYETNEREGSNAASEHFNQYQTPIIEVSSLDEYLDEFYPNRDIKFHFDEKLDKKILNKFDEVNYDEDSFTANFIFVKEKIKIISDVQILDVDSIEDSVSNYNKFLVNFLNSKLLEFVKYFNKNNFHNNTYIHDEGKYTDELRLPLIPMHQAADIRFSFAANPPEQSTDKYQIMNSYQLAFSFNIKKNTVNMYYTISKDYPNSINRTFKINEYKEMLKIIKDKFKEVHPDIILY